MHSIKFKKIQALLINHLLKFGVVELLLPDGVTVEINVTQEGKNGTKVVDDYCAVRTSREGNCAVLDRYNLGIEYVESQKTLICVDSITDSVGRNIKRMEVI